MFKRIMQWLDQRAQRDALYAEYLANGKMKWGVQ